MTDEFLACTLPWQIWPWGITLTHSDTDVNPECSVEFGVQVVRRSPPFEQLWVRLDFELAAFASANPHRDDERVSQVTGYDIRPRRGPRGEESSQRLEAEWLRTGLCPDPGIYFTKDSRWLRGSRDAWAARQRTDLTADEAVHFLLDGRDGYVEILAAGFTWKAWHRGRPLLSDVSGDPIASGRWVDGDPPTD